MRMFDCERIYASVSRRKWNTCTAITLNVQRISYCFIRWCRWCRMYWYNVLANICDVPIGRWFTFEWFCGFIVQRFHIKLGIFLWYDTEVTANCYSFIKYIALNAPFFLSPFSQTYFRIDYTKQCQHRRNRWLKKKSPTFLHSDGIWLWLLHDD